MKNQNAKTTAELWWRKPKCYVNEAMPHVHDRKTQCCKDVSSSQLQSIDLRWFPNKIPAVCFMDIHIPNCDTEREHSRVNTISKGSTAKRKNTLWLQFLLGGNGNQLAWNNQKHGQINKRSSIWENPKICTHKYSQPRQSISKILYLQQILLKQLTICI